MNAWYYFTALIVLSIGLFALAWLKGRRYSTNCAHDPQQVLLMRSEQLLANTQIQVLLSGGYLSLYKNGKKSALLTVDARLSDGSRKMGAVTIINFRHLPSITTLKKTLIAHDILPRQ